MDVVAITPLPLSTLLPALLAIVCLLGFVQSQREGRARRATLFAIGMVIGFLLAIWGWLNAVPA